MKNYIYVLYNVLSNRYESVMSFPSDSMALHRLNGHVDKKEFSLCRIGSINIESGVCEVESPIRLIWEEDNTDLPKSEAQ